MQKKLISISLALLLFVLATLFILFFIGTRNGSESFTETIGLDDSLHKKRVTFLKEESNKEKGYLVLKAKPENSAPINISGWKLVIEGEENIIPAGSILPYFGEVNQLSAIQLSANDTIIISFSPSPLGVAFRENKCSGYLEEFLNFSPALPNSCPTPLAQSDEIVCQNFIEGLPSCQNKIENAPSPACKRFLSDNIGYNACITKHKNDADFFSKTWRVYIPLPALPSGPFTLIDETGKRVLDITF